MSSPAPGSTLAGASQTLVWTAATGVSSYWLYVGTSPGGSNLFDQEVGTSLTATVGGLPTDGRTIYVRLWWLISGASWAAADYTYTAGGSGGGGGGGTPAITAPKPGSTLSGSGQTFTWTAGAGISRYWLYLGSTAGGSDLLDRDMGSSVTITAAALPTDGRTIHARLWWYGGGGWAFTDSTYMAASSGGGGSASPVITTPSAGSTLTGSSQTFTWTTGTDASTYWLYLGSAAGGSDLFNQNMGTNSTVSVTGLPTDGRTIYARLWWYGASGWASADTSYRAVTTASTGAWFVAPGGTGTGTSASPFGRIQDALAAAQAGDRINIRSGTYSETLGTIRSGSAGQPITLVAADGRGTVLVTASGRVLTVSHAYIAVDGLVLDGQYGADDLVRLSGNAHYFDLRNSELRRSSRDLIDMGSVTGVTISGCLLHHALNPTNGVSDAHGIAAAAVTDLTVRDSEIHTFSGDGLQVDPGRSAPGWTRVTVERTRIWLAPLPAPENGFAAGVVPGENAIDTKASASYPRSTIVLRDITASGFRSSFIANAAAFNLKENIDATVERVTVSDSVIAFRLRGPDVGGAWVTIKNAVVYDTTTAFRYEDNIANLRIWNSTVGRSVTLPFQAASSVSTGLDVRNTLFLSGTVPAEAFDTSNLAVGAASFVNAAADDYHLAAGSPAIDTAATFGAVTTDRDGVSRPQGAAYDVGAFERVN
jgi:hypothetical protein